MINVNAMINVNEYNPVIPTWAGRCVIDDDYIDRSKEESTAVFVIDITTQLNVLAWVKRPILFLEIDNKPYKLKKPINLNIYKEESGYIAENRSFELFGFGESSQEAIEDIKKHLVYYYTYYKNLDPTLVKNRGKELKEMYESLI